MPLKSVLFIVHSLNTGGLERMVVELANNLDPDRYLPFICCIAAPGDLAAEFGRPENLFVIGNTGRINAASVARLFPFMARHRIDLIHSHNMAGLLYGFAGAKLHRIPLIHTNHGFAPPDADNAILNRLEQSMSTRIRRYVCVSESLKRSVTTRWKLRENAVVVIYNGVRVPDGPARLRAFDPAKIVVGSVGRLHPIKNYPLLLASFSEISKTFPQARLELVGDGPEFESLVALRNKLGLESTVTLKGRTRDVQKFLDTFDVFVLPSLSEGLSMSILEAMSAGNICVVSNVGGNPEIIRNRENGFLFESNNKQALIETLSHVIGNIGSPALDAVRANGLETIRERFSLAAMAKAYCALYDEVSR